MFDNEYQIVNNMDRVIDVLAFLTLKVIDVLNLLGHRCLEPYHLLLTAYCGFDLWNSEAQSFSAASSPPRCVARETGLQ